MNPASVTKLTIITVVYNDVKNIKQTLRSVIKLKNDPQRNFDISYIVIDGASTDGTLEVLNQHRKSIDVLVSEPDNGIYDAMNKATRFASDNDWLIWVNSGDIIIETIKYLPLNSSTSQAIFCSVKLEDGRITNPRINLPYDERTLFPNAVIRHQGFIIKKCFFDEIGPYSLSVGLQADGLLMSKAILSGKWETSHVQSCIFLLNGISNRAHLKTLISYFKVVNSLGLSPVLIVWHQKKYIIKAVIRIILPSAINNFISKSSKLRRVFNILL
jgi:glycosyltransferase involved in cell wall biosynthesis